MYCKECGRQIADDSKFCSSCGKPQNKDATLKLGNSSTASLQFENKIANEKAEELKRRFNQATTETETKDIFPDIKVKEKNEVFGYIIYSSIIIGVILIFIIIIAGGNNKSSSTSESNVRDQKVKARVQLEQLIRANLIDPKSYQNITIDVWTLDEYIFVKNVFRGKNLYNGYEACTFVGRFNFNTKPIEWGITNKPSSDRGCRAIMFALP